MLIHYGRQTPAVQRPRSQKAQLSSLLDSLILVVFLAGGKAIGARLLVRQNHCQEGITRIKNKSVNELSVLV